MCGICSMHICVDTSKLWINIILLFVFHYITSLFVLIKLMCHLTAINLFYQLRWILNIFFQSLINISYNLFLIWRISSNSLLIFTSGKFKSIESKFVSLVKGLVVVGLGGVKILDHDKEPYQ